MYFIVPQKLATCQDSQTPTLTIHDSLVKTIQIFMTHTTKSALGNMHKHKNSNKISLSTSMQAWQANCSELSAMKCFDTGVSKLWGVMCLITKTCACSSPTHLAILYNKYVTWTKVDPYWIQWEACHSLCAGREVVSGCRPRCSLPSTPSPAKFTFIISITVTRPNPLSCVRCVCLLSELHSYAYFHDSTVLLSGELIKMKEHEREPIIILQRSVSTTNHNPHQKA